MENSTNHTSYKMSSEEYSEFNPTIHYPLEILNSEDYESYIIEDDEEMNLNANQTSEPENHQDKLVIYGQIEKLANGLISKGWQERWCIIKNNRFGYYMNEKDTKPKAFVHLNEVDVGIPSNLTSTHEYRYSFQICDEIKEINWYFRTKDEKTLKEWLKVFDANIKHYKRSNSEPTIMELIIMIAILRIRKESSDSNSFNFNIRKTSVGSYAIAGAILMELYIRNILDIINIDEVILLPHAEYTGIGLLDDAIDIIAVQIRTKNHPPKINELISNLVEGSWVKSISTFNDNMFLSDSVRRTLYMCVKRGLLERDGSRNWNVLNTDLEEDLILKLKRLVKTPYEENNIREKSTLGIAYVLLKVATKSIETSHHIVDIEKVFPDVVTESQWENLLDALHKNLGYFDWKQGTILRALYTSIIKFIAKG